MADRIPLIVNSTVSQIQEVPTGDVVSLPNNALKFGAGLNISYTDAVPHGSKITHSGTDDLRLQIAGNQIIFEKTSGENFISCTHSDGKVNISYDGSKKFSTSGVGVTVYGALDVTGKIQPSTGSGTGNGIHWANNPGGGSGDVASITYYAETGEDTKLRITTGNDAVDDIELSTADGASVLIPANTASTSKTSGGLKVTGGVGISGALYVGGDITAFASSDATLKENITPISNAVDKVRSISGNTFTWNEKSVYNGEEGTGIIAQEIEALGLPGVTETRENGVKAVRYDRLVPLLIEAIKELDTKVKSLEG